MYAGESIGNLLVGFLRETGLEKPLLERQVVERWPEIMGVTVAKMTRSVEMEEGMLIVRLSSPALKATLFEQRREVVARINEQMGAHVVRDIRLLG